MSRPTPETAGAERLFVEKAMATIRTRLYPGVSDAVFEREWRDLLLAISEPAAYFHIRGWNGSGGIYLKILRKALDDLTTRGDSLKSRNKPQILRAWLQTHLRFKGDTYLDEVKAADGKVVASAAASIMKGIQPVANDHGAQSLTETLIAARGLLTPPPRKSRPW